LIIDAVIPTILVKKIVLGPRQMTFGFEDRLSNNIDAIFAFIGKEYQVGGPVALYDLISSETLLDDISELEILQATFWLAEELKIHFFTADNTSFPRQTKKMLINNPEASVYVVINQQVEVERFEQAINKCAGFLPALAEDVDQYTFSRHLVNELKRWQDRLTAYAPMAKQPFFPGNKEIKNGTLLLVRVLEKQDSCSMILTCLKYQSRIAQLAETITVLTEFYKKSLPFWQIFIDQMQAFEPNMAAIQKDKQISPKHRRLSEIIQSPYPYPLLAEAEQLLIKVQAFHQRVEREQVNAFRSNAMEKTDKMVKKLISLFDTFESDGDYRNERLHDLRILNKRIEQSNRIEEIDTLFNDAKDLFVDVIEDI
jgi:hypothetical protein